MWRFFVEDADCFQLKTEASRGSSLVYRDEWQWLKLLNVFSLYQNAFSLYQKIINVL